MGQSPSDLLGLIRLLAGAGIPVQMHSKEKLWVPELIFGHLLTSSNYDDTEKRSVCCRSSTPAQPWSHVIPALPVP